MAYQALEALKGVASETAAAVAGYKATAKAGWQNFAGMVGADMRALSGSAKAHAAAALAHGKQAVNEVGHQSISNLAQTGKQNVQAGADYMLNTPFGQMADDVADAMAGSGVYRTAQNAVDRTRGFGSTALGNLNAFYHNADGSYNRTRVGLTAAAGLGIAGIAGYSMND